VPGVGVVVVTTRVAVITMKRLIPRLSDHLLFRVFRVAGLGRSGEGVVVVIMTVVAMFVHLHLIGRSFLRVAASAAQPYRLADATPHAGCAATLTRDRHEQEEQGDQQRDPE
jgi:hypothetical protein